MHMHCEPLAAGAQWGSSLYLGPACTRDPWMPAVECYERVLGLRVRGRGSSEGHQENSAPLGEPVQEGIIVID